MRQADGGIAQFPKEKSPYANVHRRKSSRLKRITRLDEDVIWTCDAISESRIVGSGMEERACDEFGTGPEFERKARHDDSARIGELHDDREAEEHLFVKCLKIAV